MYGLVNRAIEDLVRKQHGEATWQRIRERAGVPGRGFVAMESYPDAITYALVGATSEELGLPPETILEAFGEFWMTYTAEEGYGELLGLMGSTFEEFMDNLDAMHTRIAATMPHLVPPTFHRAALADGSSVLHYESEREGLAPMVVGLLRGLAQRFRVAIEIEVLPVESPNRASFSLRPKR